ncbi:hypothetical protein CEXT_171201 [Caerostris extrusa]|uniref:Uncharacterized protein n=1 Tax=Caerostris extrusa TaxID=172846 RepID=A0AAV4YFQ5_CAEEX|nr:hypothetical protein CEXT_171201 [Caerostris extrusa]
MSCINAFSVAGVQQFSFRKKGPFPGLSDLATGLSWIRCRESPFRRLGPGDKLFSFCRGTLFCLYKRMLDSVHSFCQKSIMLCETCTILHMSRLFSMRFVAFRIQIIIAECEYVDDG